ncbi:hypothetical protein ACQ4PT_015258 [Festuca glaucescens]
MAAATKKQPPASAGGGEPAAVVDPKFEWAEKADGYVLRLALPGFRKDHFRVQVDGAGRLTVRGARPAGTGTAAGQSSFSKVFQLPSAASLDDIAGRFEAGVLTLTVPKRASSAPMPTSIEDIKKKQPSVAKENKPKEDDIVKDDASKKKAMDEASKKTQQPLKQEEDGSKGKQEQQKPAPAQVEKEEVKPNAPQAATVPPQKPAPVKKQEEMKPKAPQATAASPPEKPAPAPEAASGANKPKAAVVAPESLAERVRRRREEEGANAATMAAAKRAKTDGEKKAISACIGWTKRVQGGLKVPTDMKWVDGVVEAARKNKEVVAVGVAAFSLGFLVSQKLFRK